MLRRGAGAAPGGGGPGVAGIRVLAPEVSQRIAAGEVVERPASVVKELCDNALDAGARRIAVALAAGGCAEISVTDDGCGIPAAELPLAFARHATSKLTSFEDLGELRTLGFRGEALPSIAAVARVEIVTRPAGEASGARLVLEGGAAAGGGPEVAAAAPGTRVCVRDLFFNVPARRAALRAPAQELAAATEAVVAAALARPDVAFRLSHEGREVVGSPGDGELLSALVALWGPDVARSLLPVRASGEGWTLEGFCGTPAGARGNRGLQYLAVDGRPVRSELLRGAIEAAYRHHLMVHRYPLFALGLRARPGLYDPNVHPSKAEVRIYRAQAVRDLCHRAVRDALSAARLVPDVPVRAVPAAAEGPAAYGPERPEPWAATEVRAAPLLPPAEQSRAFPELRPLGQAARRFLLAEGDDGLYLVDQHAAHERVFFEELAGRGAGPGRLLLAPAVLTLGASALERFGERGEALAAVGLVAEPFGEGTLLVRALPAGLDGADPAATVAELLERMDDPLHAGLPAARLALAACRASVKAGQALDPEDAAALLRQLAGCRDPFHCPHGRPTLLRLGWSELERHFGRR